MKRITLLLGLMVAAAAGPLLAQDTLQLRDMRLVSNLYVYGWPDTFKTDPNKIHEGNFAGIELGYSGNEWFNQYAWRVFGDDTLQVLGIAASVSTALQWTQTDTWQVIGADTSLANSSIFLRLYEADADSLRYLGDEQEVHMQNTPVSYYIDLDLWDPGFINKWPAIPVYERFFSSPFTMTDSFYVGYRCRTDHEYNYYTNVCGFFITNHMHTNPTTFEATLLDTLLPDPITGEDGPYLHFWIYTPNDNYYSMIFPIIAPPDTTGLDDTTGVGVEKPDMMYRYTSVAPNPATDRVRVTSSFGLQDIVAYNEAGSKVYEGKASGMVATLDVSTWPRGPYLLRITTPMGTTVKKLLVQ